MLPPKAPAAKSQGGSEESKRRQCRGGDPQPRAVGAQSPPPGHTVLGDQKASRGCACRPLDPKALPISGCGYETSRKCL